MIEIEVEDADGETIRFECEDTIASRWVSRDILSGDTYPYLPFVDDVTTILDIGANCGAASVHFARHWPDATIHSFEPGGAQRGALERNTAAFPNVHVHPIGLYSRDDEVPLYKGDGDSGMSSIIRGEWNTDDHEVITLRDAGAWAAEHGVTRADVVKLDVEGVEVDVLEALTALLPTVKLLYVEYDSRVARRRIDEILAPTMELYAAKIYLDQGEVVYLGAEVADDPRATEWLRQLFVPS
jgi:FkbM family methyltransferase